MPRYRDVVFNRLDAGGRNIGDHVTRAEIGCECLQPLDIDLELVAPGRCRNVERIERRFAQNSVDGEPVAGLKPPHRLRDIRIVNIVRGGARIEISRNRKPRAQVDHARVAHAEPQVVDFGNRRPAAAGHDPVIGIDGVLGGFRGRRRQRRRGRLRHVDGARGLDRVISLDGVPGGVSSRRRQRRRGRLRHVDGARGLIEGLAEFAAVGIADQRVERGFVGEGPLGRQAGKGRPAGVT